MDARYNVYFAGQLLDGHTPASVRDRMARLFNADEATLDKLFSGKPQLLKRDCDKATAVKFKQAMEQAGALPVIKAAPAPAPAATTARPMSAAERIAALAAAPDLTYQKNPAAGQVAAAPTPEPAEGDVRLAPPGTDVLLPGERQAPATSSVSAPDLDVFARGERLSDTPPPPPPAPDTSHLSAADAGEALPAPPQSAIPPAPDTSAIALAPEGTDLSDCAVPPAAAPALDLSGIDLAPAGADVLETRYRNKHDQPAPATDHLSLDD